MCAHLFDAKHFVDETKSCLKHVKRPVQRASRLGAEEEQETGGRGQGRGGERRRDKGESEAQTREAG